jgi:two-component system sensor histidine kinase UhpB
MSLRLRLTLSIALILAVTLGLGGALAWVRATRSVRTEMDAALAVGEHAVRNSMPHLATGAGRNDELRQLIGAFDGDRHLRVTLIGAKGEIVARSSLSNPAIAAPRWFAQLLGRDAPSRDLALPPDLGPGAIRLETDPRNEIGEVWSGLDDMVVTILLFAALILALAFWILRRALRPLEQLSLAFVDVGPGVSSIRLEERGPAELERLTRGFNAMVDRLARSENRNRRLNEQLATIQDEERAELARDLHDDVGPYLFAIGVDAAAIRQSAEAIGHVEILNQVRSVRDGVSHVQQQVRAILGRLRAGGLAEFGLHRAIRNLTEFWLARHPGLVITVEIAGAETGFGEALDAAIYRIVQESLVNAVRHGQPRTISIGIGPESDGALNITVSDDGGGLGQPVPARGMGVRGMAERVTALGGEFKIANRPEGAGVAVTARLPLHGEHDEMAPA